jgi:hypothetical protein
VGRAFDEEFAVAASELEETKRDCFAKELGRWMPFLFNMEFGLNSSSSSTVSSSTEKKVLM